MRSHFPIRLAAALVTVLALPATGLAQSRGQAEADLGGKKVSITYGRPGLAGRTSPHKLLPVGRVWRLGMNQATILTSEADLKFGAVKIPAGSYSLFAKKIGEGQWHLVFNRQTGQWGTQYDESQNLAEVPLKTIEGSSPTEQFTIEIKPQGGSAQLNMTWGITTLSTEFQAE